MRPPRPDIAAPELPNRVRWLNADRRPRIAELAAAGPVLVHFFDFAQLNSVRALPYVLAWAERYGDAGLAVLGVHSPRFTFTADRERLAPALPRLGISHPVADDADYVVWRDYGCRGWPSLFLWRRGGALRWAHFGEGEYEATEREIQDELRDRDPNVSLPEPLAPLRATDAAGALVAPPSDEVLPGGSESQPWRAGDGAEPLELAYEAGGAHASVDGGGELRVAIDGEERAVPVDAPGLVDLAVHARHERHRLRLAGDGGIEVYSVSFSAGLPA
ncbi:MAG: hypothetical protein ACRDK9_08425 [Solirubrobacterales bacterium]